MSPEIWQTKTCGLCHATKPLHDFPTNTATKDGRHTYCRPCYRDYQRDWARRVNGHKPMTKHDPTTPKVCARCKIEKAPDEFPIDPQRSGQLYSYCKPCKAAYMRAFMRADNYGNRARLKRICKERGITVDDYLRMLADQDGRCAICGGPSTGNHGRLVIDHDHETNRVRALLCGHCNFIIGLAGDDPDRLRRAADYIEEHRHSAEQKEKPRQPLV